MPAANCILPPWDYLSPMGEGMGGGILIYNEGITSSLSSVQAFGAGWYNNLGFRIPFHSALGLLAKVRTWRIAGDVHFFNTIGGADQGTFSVSIDLTASQFLNVSDDPLTDETEICKHGGWFGSGDGSSNFRFSAEWFPPGTVDEIGRADANGVESVTFYPGLGGITAGPFGLAAGAIAAADACFVTATFPDIYGCTGFTFQLGSTATIDGSISVSGSLTMMPVAYWSYGGKWNTATGARL